MPTVQVLRPFSNEHPDRIVQPGDLIEVTADRARALAENGLVAPAAAAKAAPIPANKMMPAPANKAPPAPEPKRRGRPPGKRSV